MNLSGDWRSLFPVASVFAPPSAARSRGALLFSPLPPAVSLLSLPFPIPPPPQLASSRGLHRFLRAYITATSFLPLADLDSLASDLLAPPPSPFPPPSNLLAVLRRPSSSLLVVAPRILPLRRECRAGLSRIKSESLALVPVAKQGFDAAVVHACWSRHLPSECIVLLENGELCWFNLDSCNGGKMRVDLGSTDDCGNWLSCDYGAKPWMVIIATSKSVLLVDLRFASRGEYKHGLENPNNVAMFQLSELWPSKEHELASKSDQRCGCSNGIVKDVLSLPVSRDGSDPQENKSLTIGYYVLPIGEVRDSKVSQINRCIHDDIPFQRILNGLPSNILCVTFSKYKDMVACSGERAAEHLDVPSLMRNELRPFLLAKPSSISDNLTSKVLRRDPLVGPVLPIHVLLAMEQRNKDVESSSQDALDEIDSCLQITFITVANATILSDTEIVGLHCNFWKYRPLI
ncbi:hypothetical protein PR202_gb19172 [Eleusine coracana subsp. coracana]|uniref:Uncharacterized protein n=1 Tax=Eleusine coracana subsp. coracana TaxID=191504 RepID=A0AAV5F5A9_ELECO|nr:hypothetical protein PR202_gb19172 [Eleusine coracana subsp. coracana]